MAENNDDIEIPLNADKFLFAEDLIMYVIRRDSRVPNAARISQPYRKFVYSFFNETTEMAVWLLYSSMALEYSRVFSSLHAENAVDLETYAKLANDVTARFFPTGFVAERYLLFCAHVASLAAYFYAKGFQEALDLAVLYIVKPIHGIDMYSGGWDTLTCSALSYAIMAQDSGEVVDGMREPRPRCRRS